MTRFDAIDLARLTPPQVVETLSFEGLVAAMKADFAARFPDFTANLESDPVVKVLEVAAYRELVLRARVNDAAKAVLLAHATGSDLDNLAALLGTERREITPADNNTTPPTPAVMESDDELRARAQLAWEALSVAGPEGAYVYHALSADGRVKDVSVTSPAPHEVVITALGRDGDGTLAAREIVTDQRVVLTVEGTVLEGTGITDLAVDGLVEGEDYVWDPDTGRMTPTASGHCLPGTTVTVHYERAGPLELVSRRLSDKDVRPIGDRVAVRSASIVPYSVVATLWMYGGPSAAPVLAAAEHAVRETTARLHALGHDVTVSALYAALHRPGVQRVLLVTPTQDIVVAADQAAFCHDVSLTLGGRDV